MTCRDCILARLFQILDGSGRSLSGDSSSGCAFSEQFLSPHRSQRCDPVCSAVLRSHVAHSSCGPITRALAAVLDAHNNRHHLLVHLSAVLDLLRSLAAYRCPGSLRRRHDSLLTYRAVNGSFGAPSSCPPGRIRSTIAPPRFCFDDDLVGISLHSHRDPLAICRH